MEPACSARGCSIGNVVVFAALLAFADPAISSSWWLAMLVMVGPTTACFALAVVGGPRRAAAIWLGIAMVLWSAGNLIFLKWTQFQADPPVPSPADLFYLVFYVFVLGAVVCLVRCDRGATTRSLWLDGALGAAGGATALAAVISPVLSELQGDLGEVLVGASFAVADLLLVAAICGVLAVRGLRGGSVWFWLAGGLAIFCAADVIYALRVTSETFVVGSVLSLLWALGLTVVALALWRPQRPAAIESGRSVAILAIPMLATSTAVVVLVIASFAALSSVVVALATLTLALAAARTFVGFQQVQRLSDARRQAVTDDLTGLGNRRHLFEHGAERLAATAPRDRLALLLIDLDNFKELNDTLGHHAGDQLLREVARRLAARVSHPDLLVRLGGDEFALVIALGGGRRRPPGRGADPRASHAPARNRGRAAARGRERRRRGAPRRRPDDRGPAAPRGRRDVRREGQPRTGRALRPGARRRQSCPARDDPGPRLGARPSRVRAALPAQDRSPQRARRSAPRRSCAGSTRRADCSIPMRSCRSSSRAA